MDTLIFPRTLLRFFAVILIALALSMPNWAAAGTDVDVTAALVWPSTLLASQTASSSGMLKPSTAWHTFYGSIEMDEGWNMALDESGNVYLTGYSRTGWLGEGASTPLHPHSGNDDILVLKLDAGGTYQWHTFYGSSGADYGIGIVVDEDGDVYVSGCSDNTWNGDGDVAPLHPRSGFAQDLFVMKLNSNGAYQWHTFYGGGSTDSANAIALDGMGGVFVAGEAFGTWQGDGGAEPLHPASQSHEIFVMKLDVTGAYDWHTFYGAYLFDETMSCAEKAYALALDDAGYLYIGGESFCSWLGDNDEEPLHAHSEDYDWVILKLDPDGGYEWHTFYGANDSDTGFGIGVDADDYVYLTGQVTGTWQGDGDTSPIHAASGMMDIGVIKLDTNGAYQWHTFYGSAVNDTARGLALDVAANIYVAGSSIDWLGDNSQPPIHAYSEGYDQVVLTLAPDGAFRWHTFYGSNSGDAGYGIAVDEDGPVYFCGVSQYTWLREGDAEPIHAHSGWIDISIVKLDERLVYLPYIAK